MITTRSQVRETFINSRHLPLSSSLFLHRSTSFLLRTMPHQDISTNRARIIAMSGARLQTGGYYLRLGSNSNNYTRVKYSHLVAITTEALGHRL